MGRRDNEENLYGDRTGHSLDGKLFNTRLRRVDRTGQLAFHPDQPVRFSFRQLRREVAADARGRLPRPPERAPRVTHFSSGRLLVEGAASKRSVSEAVRPTCGAADQVRTIYQSQDRRDTWSLIVADVARDSRRGDRIRSTDFRCWQILLQKSKIERRQKTRESRFLDANTAA